MHCVDAVTACTSLLAARQSATSTPWFRADRGELGQSATVNTPLAAIERRPNGAWRPARRSHKTRTLTLLSCASRAGTQQAANRCASIHKSIARTICNGCCMASLESRRGQVQVRRTVHRAETAPARCSEFDQICHRRRPQQTSLSIISDARQRAAYCLKVCDGLGVFVVSLPALARLESQLGVTQQRFCCRRSVG